MGFFAPQSKHIWHLINNPTALTELHATNLVCRFGLEFLKDLYRLCFRRKSHDRNATETNGESQDLEARLLLRLSGAIAAGLEDTVSLGE